MRSIGFVFVALMTCIQATDFLDFHSVINPCLLEPNISVAPRGFITLAPWSYFKLHVKFFIDSKLLYQGDAWTSVLKMNKGHFFKNRFPLKQFLKRMRPIERKIMLYIMDDLKSQVAQFSTYKMAPNLNHDFGTDNPIKFFKALMACSHKPDHECSKKRHISDICVELSIEDAQILHPKTTTTTPRPQW